MSDTVTIRISGKICVFDDGWTKEQLCKRNWLRLHRTFSLFFKLSPDFIENKFVYVFHHSIFNVSNFKKNMWHTQYTVQAQDLDPSLVGAV